MNKTVRWFIALALLAAPLAACAAEESKSEGAVSEPVKSIFDHYLAIQRELAKDSLKGVADHSSALATAVRGDPEKKLPLEVAKQAEALSKAKDLKATREAFKPLSASLVKYLADHPAGKGVYREAYCPMAKASWLQTEKEVRNPFYGKSMLDCGTFKN